MPEKEIKISGKVLGQLNMPDFCPRCFWIKHHVKNLPYQIFPGIFSSIDAYSKRVLHAWFDSHQEAPIWLPELKGVVRYHKAPHWSKFKRFDPATGITVSGAVDDLFECVDSEFIIPDYKTAKYTESQDKLHPLYSGQLNAYKWIFEKDGQKVKSLPLIYCEPATAEENCVSSIFHHDGFSMRFTVKAVPVEIDDTLVTRLLRQAADIIYLERPPYSGADCEDCGKMIKLGLAVGVGI